MNETLSQDERSDAADVSWLVEVRQPPVAHPDSRHCFPFTPFEQIPEALLWVEFGRIPR